MHINKKITSVLLNASMNDSIFCTTKIVSGLLFAFIISAATLSWCSDGASNDCDAFYNSSSYDTSDNLLENEPINNVSFLLAQPDFNPASSLSLPLSDSGSVPMPGLLQLLMPLESALCCANGPLERSHSIDKLGKNAQTVSIAHMAPRAARFERKGTEGDVSEEVAAVSGKRKRDDTGDATELPEAKKTCAREKLFTCSYGACKFAAKQKCRLKSHIKTHTGEKPFKCAHEGCTYAASILSNLKVHIRTHTDEKPFKCVHENCTYASARSSNLKVHTRTHTGEKPFECAYCTYRATNSNNLKAHMKTHHNIVKKFICKRCNYATPQVNDFENHLNGCA